MSNSISHAELIQEKIKAAWRADPCIVMSWEQAQASTHRLRQQLRERGWDDSDIAFAVQELMRSTIAQIKELDQ